MPVTQLFVEGELDTKLLSAVFDEMGLGTLVLQKGAKYGLEQKVRDARSALGDTVFYFRDRDFDFGQTKMGTSPVQIEANFNGIKKDVGWCWSRHELENYLAEPALLSYVASLVAKRPVSIEEVTTKLVEVAKTLRWYQAARWTIGTAKKVLPPYNKEIHSRPVAEWRVPALDALKAETSIGWVVDMTAPFLKHVQDVLKEEQLRAKFQEYSDLFSEKNCENIDWVLHMCSGKDLLAGLNEWFIELGFQSAKQLATKTVDLVVEDPERAIEHVPEFRTLCDHIRAIE